MVVDICGTPPPQKKLKSKEDKWKHNSNVEEEDLREASR